MLQNYIQIIYLHNGQSRYIRFTFEHGYKIDWVIDFQHFMKALKTHLNLSTFKASKK